MKEVRCQGCGKQVVWNIGGFGWCCVQHWKKKNLCMNKKLFWSLRITLGIFGVVALYQIVPDLMKLISMIIQLFKLTDTTPEFKIILLCISIWVTCSVFNVITNLVFKLHGLLETKIFNQKDGDRE